MMNKIKSFILAAVAFALVAPAFTACSSSDDDNKKDNIVSEYTINDNLVAAKKAQSKKDVAVLLVAFGSTWDNAFKAFDKTIAAYEAAFPQADVYMSFSSDICINRASAGENVDDEGNIVKRDYYEPRYLLHAIGKAKYSKIYVQSLQVIPGEEFAAVVASVKKFMNNGYIADAHLDDDYLAKLSSTESIFLGMPLLNDPDADIPAVAQQLHALYAKEAAQGVVAFMGHGNPDNYDTFKANVRYSQLEEELQKLSPNYFVGTVDMPDNYKENVLERMQEAGLTNGKVYLHALMSIAGDHAHNDMADEEDPESWVSLFNKADIETAAYETNFTEACWKNTAEIKANGYIPGLAERSAVRALWKKHTSDAIKKLGTDAAMSTPTTASE